MDPAQMSHKIVCIECGWQGLLDDRPVADNAFEPGSDIDDCPTCRQIESLRVACDEDDCWERVTCGTPTPGAYRHTCSKHRPKTNGG